MWACSRLSQDPSQLSWVMARSLPHDTVIGEFCQHAVYTRTTAFSMREPHIVPTTLVAPSRISRTCPALPVMKSVYYQSASLWLAVWSVKRHPNEVAAILEYAPDCLATSLCSRRVSSREGIEAVVSFDSHVEPESCYHFVGAFVMSWSSAQGHALAARDSQ